MSTVNQGMLDGLPGTQVASLGTVGGLSTSDTKRLLDAYPGGPQMAGSTVKTSATVLPGDEATTAFSLKSENYRSFYESKVMSGMITTSEFNEEVDLQYGLAPSIPGDVSDIAGDEDKFGKDGSTIVPSGLGPNVNVTNFNGREQEMVNPKAEPQIKLTLGDFIENTTDPKTSSTLIAQGGVKGGGIKGESNS